MLPVLEGRPLPTPILVNNCERVCELSCSQNDWQTNNTDHVTTVALAQVKIITQQQQTSHHTFSDLEFSYQK